MKYGKALKIIRAAVGISQQELAQKTSISKSLISRIESGDRNLSKTNLNKISQKLNIPSDLIKLLAYEKEEVKKVDKGKVEDLGRVLLKIILLNETNKQK